MNHFSAQSLTSTLESYSLLKNDWDSEGACAPTTEDINNAFKFIRLIQEQDVQEPIIGISSSGEINFVWDDKELGIYIDIGFKNGGYSYYCMNKNEQEKLKNEEQYNKDDLICLMEILKPKFEVHI
ncbi:hypothetical protein [Legionella cincinnatiensis]|jgi:hypothetical protein|uniref:Uncharacterized protein n=1 Tax=Legionella cincinnatiensis TaxID=28085 RepID=A0A378IKY3_9GAMM|nr:hypothetical protein [Legionella cincinnatiensis]KTC88574.1 hypothetical protein Lcin_1451 [Legionella cincinnatiensis]STX35937.1 Uncharacterised protein [Legionella cincinnatiensis]